MRIMVTGSRRWPDIPYYRAIVNKAVWAYVLEGDTLVHGGAKGADTFAHYAALTNRAIPEVWKPEYEKHGKGAPLVRNIEMLDSGVDLVLAFLYGYPEHGGTKHVIENAQRRGIPVIVFNWPER